MAVARVQGTAKRVTGVTSTTLQLASAPASNNLLGAGMKIGPTTVAVSISDNDSNTWITGASVTDISDGSNVSADWLAVVTSLSPNANPTVTYSTNGAAGNPSVSLDEYSGCATASVLRDSGTNGSSAAVGTLTATTVGAAAVAGDLAIDYFYTGATTQTKDAAYTAGSQDAAGPNTRLGTYWEALGSGGSQSNVTTLSPNQNCASHIVIVKAAGGAPPVAVQPPMRTLRGAGV